MKQYILFCISLLTVLASSAQSGQSSGAPANVEAVDLGLPSETRWASCNVGATKPEEYGNYYAWGETETKEVYDWNTYIHCDGSKETCRSLDGNICGTQYDVAYVKWGHNWRMPTLNEIEELVDNCTYTVTELNSVQVMKLTGPNGNSIYLPFTGYMDGTERKSIGYNNGYYWSGVNPYSNPLAPCMVPSASGNVSYDNAWDKCHGLMVRPVLNVVSSVPRTYIDLGLPSGTKWANMNVGASRPEEYGKYFAWGETLAKDSYSWDNYMCPEATCGKPGDPVFDLVGNEADIAGTKFDAATINWGASWNMPTAKQVEELASNCYSSPITINGVLCRKLTSRINGNEIIFPLAGARWFENFAYEGSLGYYWASTLRQGGYVSPCRLIVREHDHGWGWSMGGENDRFSGFPIRPVFVETLSTEDTITYHKFSVAFNDDGLPERFASGVSFQRNGDSDSYSLSIDDQQSPKSTFDISEISYVTRKTLGQLSLPEASGLNVNDMTITVDGDTISTDDNGNYDAAGSILMATNTEGEIVYMNIASVEDGTDAVGADLNAKESALTLMLPLIPNIFVAFDDEYLPKLKEMIWDVDEVKQLAAAIDRSVIKFGYTDFGEISKEATDARNRMSQLLHLDKWAERQAKSVSMASSKAMIKASGSKDSPYIINPNGYGGLQVVITDSEKKQFYYPYTISGYNCEVTAYNTNRFAYSSLVKGKYDAETNTYYIPDLGNDYEYYKNILKPQKVSTFLNTFTSFKYEDLERLYQLWEETLDPNIGVNEMHWDDMKETAYFDISAQDDAIVLLFPRGNDYMMVYNIMQSVMKPIVKIISKKSAKLFDSDIFFPIICGKMINDPNYILEVKSAMFDSDLNSVEKMDKITSVTWTKFYKLINDLAWDKLDDGLKDALKTLIDETALKAGGIQAAFDWTNIKLTFKFIGWIKKYGDLLIGVLGTFFEENAFYPIHWNANGQFVLAQNEATVGEGEDINVRILVGGGSYHAESSDEEIATVTGSYDKVKIHGVDAGDAVITVMDKIAQKTAKINVHVTGLQSFVLAESKVSVPMYKDCSVTIERGDGPFHILGGDETIAVAKLVPKLFPGEKNKVIISGVSEGSTTFEIYNEATDQSLPLEVNVTAEQVTITDERIVDLGLSVNWANCNVGASSPEEYGDYFAWGEVEPKDYYSLNNYKYYYNGKFADIGSDISGTECDAATYNMGNAWRMPTEAEYDELINKCEWKFVTYRRKRGWKVTGPSGNSIFLPVAGYMLDDWNDYASIEGFYWSSNITDNNREVYTLYTTMDDYKMSYHYMNRFNGRTIRAVTTAKDDEDTHEYVDLGLPSGTQWATRNVGASAPEDYGDYFAWGETTPKEEYTWDNYKWCNGDWKTMTKYCINNSYGYNGFTDGKKELDPEDDAAYKNWGAPWRMPTTEQQKELCNLCAWQWVTRNGVNGHLVTGPNGNTLFLPATFDLSQSNDNEDFRGSYWLRMLSSIDSYLATSLYFVSWNWDRKDYDRYEGLPVRAVRVPALYIKQQNLDLDAVLIHETQTGELTINNNSISTQMVTATIDAPFAFKQGDSYTSSLTLAVPNNSTSSVTVVFTVTTPGDYDGNVTFVSDAFDGGQCIVPVHTRAVTDEALRHDYVDLGLPSGTLWAKCNVGSSTPEGTGEYFAWGEISPKEDYTWENYKWCNGCEDTLTKYCTNSAYGTVDNKRVLELDDDAAYVNWGPSWRMPSVEQQCELAEYCSWKWTVKNGVIGCQVTGPNGKWIFLPASGGFANGKIIWLDWRGYYWSNTLYSRYNPIGAYRIYFTDSGTVYWNNSYYYFDAARYEGNTIRAVRVP